jgi:hypothetical protein
MRSKKMKQGFKDKIESSTGARAAFTWRGHWDDSADIKKGHH